MTREWEPEHYAAFAVLALSTALLLMAEFVKLRALSFYILAIALWGLPIVLSLVLSASLRTGIITMIAIRTERRYEPGLYWILIVAEVAFLAALILALLTNPLWGRR
jgi:hypothetical protein